MNPAEKADALIEALPYLQAFRSKTILIKMGGSAMEDPELVANVMRDITFLEVAGINPVVVHGGGKTIRHRSEIHQRPPLHQRGGDRYRFACPF
jgi:acetylglutamate kinase